MTGSNIKRIAYYISAHGYGHAVRSAVILEKLLRDYRVHIKTEIPLEFFKLNLDKPFDLTRTAVDAGCSQDNSIHVNEEQSFRNLEKFYERHEECLENETRWLEENKIDLVISDIASRPLKAGQRVGIPSVLIANFTWHDIYSHFPGAGKHITLLNKLEEEYSAASLQILPQCYLDNAVVAQQEVTGFIAQKGKSVRRELASALSVSLQDKTLVFIYLGESGKVDVSWKQLKDIGDCLFITRDPLPAGLEDVSNLFMLNEAFPHKDLIASSDIVCTKAGYSTLASAFAHGKPVITCARKNFHEFTAVQDFLIEKQVGVIVDDEHFYSGRWAESIKKALQMTVKGKIKLDGEVGVLKAINSFLGD